MQRVHFRLDDLARIKVVSTGGPAVETLFAMELLGQRRGGPLFGAWREATRQRFGARARVVEPGLLTEALFREENDQAAGCGALDDFRDAAITPYWPQARAYLDADREHRSRIFVCGGVEALLGTLHPAVNWSPPVLEITHDRDEDIYPDGAGLVIMPSLFLFGRPTVFVDPHRPDAAPRLVYPVPMDAGISATLWEGRPRRGKALGALMGRTRAEILHALSEHCNTTELGRRVGISTAAASQHATVLRAAGLISSKRRLNTVEHSLTALGSTLVEGIDTDLVKSG